MGLPIIVEISIGLAFIYLVLSLLASEIQELIATVLQWRAKHLKDSIINLFTGDIHSTHSIQKAQQLTKQVYQHPLVQGMNQESMGRVPNLFRKITWFISNVYRGAIGQEEGEFNDQRTAPSYISREAFATALLEQLGTKHFVERLVEAKFSKFIETINEKINDTLQGNEALSAEYKDSWEGKIRNIETEFKDKKIDLRSAINSVSQTLNKFLGSQESADDEALRETLREWKSRFFVEKENRKSDTETKGIIINAEQIIETFGLKPSLEEIVESIDKGSKIYNTYKEKFRDYEEKRFKAVYKDLNQFENFLSRFLQELVKEFYSDGAEVLSKKYLHDEIDALDTEFFISLGSKEDPEFQRTKRPLSEINKVILEKLNSLKDFEPSGNANSGSSEKTPQSPQKLKNSLRAFIEGFEGKTNLFYPQDILWSRRAFQCKVASLVLFFGLGILMVFVLKDPSILGAFSRKIHQLLLHPWWGSAISLLVLLVGLLLVTSSERKNISRSGSEARNSLAGIFDDYFANEAFNKKASEDILESHSNVSQENLKEVDLRLMSLKRIENLPSEDKQVVIVAKINNTYCVRSFDELGKLVLDKRLSGFLLDTEFTQELETAFSRLESLTREEKEKLARKVILEANLEANSQKLKQFSQEISRRLKKIGKEPSDLYAEMRDLGRSFRRYYLRFLLENADIDLVFIPSSVKQSLAVLVRRSKTSAKQAEDQILYLKGEVEAWYDRSMERASGVYKRNAKGFSILIGIVLAIALNANSIHILDQLAFEQELRQTVVSSAEKLVEKYEPEEGFLSDEEQDQLYRDTSQFLDNMNLPIGWDPHVVREEFNCGVKNDEPTGDDWNTLFQTCLYKTENEAAQAPENFFPPTAIAAILLTNPLIGLKSLLGWILTGIAISMGASFWFDLLSKLVKVRNTGKQLSNSDTVAQSVTKTSE